jgi:hypothetical protein
MCSGVFLPSVDLMLCLYQQLSVLALPTALFYNAAKIKKKRRPGERFFR